MHNQIPRVQGDLPLSKDPHNTHRIMDWVQKQEGAPNFIIEAKQNPMRTPNLNQSGEGLPESPPSESPPSHSSPSTPSTDSTQWEQLSTTTEKSTLSSQFEVLKGYNRVPLYERRAQWLAEQQARREQKLQTSQGGTSYSGSTAFQPNSQLPFPITAQFLRSYGGGNGISWEKRRSPQSDGSQRTVLAHPDNIYTPETASYHSTPTSSPSSPENVPDTSPLTQGPELTRGKRPRPDPPSRETSGIPSFTSLFESKWDLDRNPKLRGGDHYPKTAPRVSIHAIPGVDLEHKTKLEILLPEDENKNISRLGCVSGLGRMPFFALLVASSLGLAVFTALTTPYFASIERTRFTPAHGSYNSTFPHIRPPYVDFPTLMSIETSLEKTVESATGGSALARLLKQGEMVVNDLGTVVKHSDLNCKRTLGKRLDRFAMDAREGVNALQLFETKVGEVLDKLLEANQDFLGEFTGQLKRQRYTSIPFISKNTNITHTLIQLLDNYTRAACLLESNLEILTSAGKSIIESLDSLCQQHSPIYEEIVREFVSTERQEGTPWTRIGWESPGASVLRKMKIRERKELLATIGSHEERARGYVENIRLELESIVGELKNLRRRVSRSLANLNRVTSDTGTNYSAGISLERQLDAVKETVAAMLKRRTQRTRRNTACTMKNRPMTNETEIYQNAFTPTRTSCT